MVLTDIVIFLYLNKNYTIVLKHYKLQVILKQIGLYGEIYMV